MTSIFNDFNNIQATSTAKTQPMQSPVVVKNAIPAAQVNNDTVEIANKKPKKGIIRSTKEFIANVKKFFSTVGEYSKGIVKGIGSAIVTGSIAFSGGAAINWIRQTAANQTAKRTGDAVKQIKKIPNKLIAGVVAVGALAANIWTASLNATQKQSEIDMRWTGIEKKK